MRIQPRILILAIVLLIAFVVGQWFFFKSRFEAALPALEAQAARLGFDIQYETRTIKGFPFRLEAHYTRVRVARTDPLLSFAVEADQAVLLRQLLSTDLSLLYVDSPKVAAAMASPLPQGRTGELTFAFEAPAMQTSIRIADGALARFSAVIDQPRGQSKLFALGDFTAKQLQFHLGWPIEGRRAPDGQAAERLQTNVQFTQLTLPNRDTEPLPASLEAGEIGLGITIPSYMPLTPQGLRMWQSQTGKVDVRKLTGQWGDVTLDSGMGSFTLDGEGKVKGTLTANIKGLAALTYALDKTGALGPQVEEAALMTLRLLRTGKKAEDAVALPFDIDKGIVRLGPAPLVALGPVIPPEESQR
ncbi:MAG: DUF2125 domain-containing protein [Pseudomonadota bacterium]